MPTERRKHTGNARALLQHAKTVLGRLVAHEGRQPSSHTKFFAGDGSVQTGLINPLIAQINTALADTIVR